MPEKTKEEIHKEKVEEFKKQVDKKDKVSKREIIEQIATRELLERDYKEDTLEIVFNSSPSTRRKVISHKPTPEQMSEIMILDTLPNDKNTIDRFTELAATLTVDKQLNKEFWGKKVSISALISFIRELMTVAIQGPLPESELDKFR